MYVFFGLYHAAFLKLPATETISRKSFDTPRTFDKHKKNRVKYWHIAIKQKRSSAA